MHRRRFASEARDACGVGLVAELRAEASHQVLERGLELLERLEHRGAVGQDPLTGDGCGISLSLPDALLRAELPNLPPPGHYGVAMLFLSAQPSLRGRAREAFSLQCDAEQLEILSWRDVPLDPGAAGPHARRTLPTIVQAIVGTQPQGSRPLPERLLRARKAFERWAQASRNPAYVSSFSDRTVVYKGLLLPSQLPRFYPDLAEARCVSRHALVHQRFSTNTQPSWSRAHPYRFLAHNGEINTIRGNVNWMRARERTLLRGAHRELGLSLSPLLEAEGSDSALLDNAVEALMQAGRSLPHALMLAIPPAWQQDTELDAEARAFYRYHASLVEPWDGPACVAFADGRYAGALVDRNGLRPARYQVSKDGLFVLASEAGVIDMRPEDTLVLGRVGPGDMLVADLHLGRFFSRAELVHELADAHPYAAWSERYETELELHGEVEAPARDTLKPRRMRAQTQPVRMLNEDRDPKGRLRRFQLRQGYHQETLTEVLLPMAKTGQEPVGSMGNDAVPACLNPAPQCFFDYFRQRFAQVTNPAIDPLREGCVMSLRSTLGPRPELFDTEPQPTPQLVLASPVLLSEDMRALEALPPPTHRLARLQARFSAREGGTALEASLERLVEAACEQVREGVSLLLIDDGEGQDDGYAAIPSLLATAAVHQGLVQEGLRASVGLVVRASDVSEATHHALLLAFGATAIFPWLVYASLDEAIGTGHAPADAARRYQQAVDKALLKIMSKLGISTLQSYRGAGSFEALGLAEALVTRFFPGIETSLPWVGVDRVAEDCAKRAEQAVARGDWREALPHRGVYRWRRDGVAHLYTPQVVGLLQDAVRRGNREVFARYCEAADAESAAPHAVRGLLRVVPSTQAVPLEEVEDTGAIVQRFKTGAMSLGSLSREAHENLATAMNTLGARSNSGEGGEDPARYADLRRSAIKQVASGRFGVTIDYLTHAQELQIKVAQGAKPGEGGQLPGFKVDSYIAQLRFAKPGVTLISPPPHHDIYSIEELAQLIFDLREANPQARISVKLVAGAGVGTIAAGVAKAGADTILVSGASGGTGASPLGSIKHAGMPWELGLRDVHHTLVAEGLRGRVRLETDGQLKTPLDVIIAALLGAEEFGFGTAALIASGCVMMRACHLNTCPVGVATQDPELRARFRGEPAHVVNLMSFIAEGVRRWMAALGVRQFAELVGHSEWLTPNIQAVTRVRGSVTEVQRLLEPAGAVTETALAKPPAQPTALILALSEAQASGAATFEGYVRNTDRSVGTRLSHQRAASGQRNPLRIALAGTAGQSFGAFLGEGLELALEGPANDGCAKGLSGGTVIVRPPAKALYAKPASDTLADLGLGATRYETPRPVLIGNGALYGATRGQLYVAGAAGERFAVRNSGAIAVVEEVGDHGCEYMTGGRVVVLGPLGRNFAAGMTGGEALLLRGDWPVEPRLNAPDLQQGAPDATCVDGLRTLLQTHQQHTGSSLSARLLEEDALAARFLWLRPHRAAAEEAG